MGEKSKGVLVRIPQYLLDDIRTIFEDLTTEQDTTTVRIAIIRFIKIYKQQKEEIERLKKMLEKCLEKIK